MRFVHETRLPHPPALVRAWHARPGAFERLQPPWGPARVLERQGTIAEGDRLSFALPPLGTRWVAVHHDHPDGFVDEMVEGPMRRWQHVHRFLPDGDGCRLVDEIDYDFFGPTSFIEGRLAPMFRFRAARLAADLARLPARPLRVAVAGSSGLLGGALLPFLRTAGHEVLALVRREPRAGELRWDPAAGRLELPEVDAVINLAGEGIADARWTATRKQALRDSRLGPTATLARALADRPEVCWINASGIGFYGEGGDEVRTEDSPRGAGFLAELCEAWEAAAQAPGRVVPLRIGVVMTRLGGALPKMLGPAAFGANGPLGTGRQWQSWIGLDDLLYVIARILGDPGLRGPVNACSPEPVRQIELARVLGGIIGRPAWAPAPAFALRVAFGEMADEALLSSTRALPAKLGPQPWFTPGLEATLRWELGQ